MQMDIGRGRNRESGRERERDRKNEANNRRMYSFACLGLACSVHVGSTNVHKPASLFSVSVHVSTITCEDIKGRGQPSV